MNMIWPIALIVLCNTLYQVCAKAVPSSMDPLASLSATYLVGAAACVILYYLFDREADLLKQYSQLNWAPILLGLVVVGLEFGFICAYRAGWPVSTAQTVQSAFLAVSLILLGYFAYHEAITWNKVVGIGLCLVGLGFINK